MLFHFYMATTAQVLEPNLKDYHGLLDAIANNTLTTGVAGSYDPNAFLARDGKTRKSWITGKRGACPLLARRMRCMHENTA